MGIAGIEQFVGIQCKPLVKQHLATLNVVDVSTHLIHAIGRGRCHHIIDARTGKAAVGEVDGLIAAVAEEDTILGYPLHSRKTFLQLQLQRIGVAVEGLVVGILVRIEEHSCFATCIFVAGRAIGCKVPDVGSCELLKGFHV